MTIFIGIDWSETHHDICILQENGSRLSAFQVEHTPKGFAKLEQQIEKLGLPAEENLVALETSHNLLRVCNPYLVIMLPEAKSQNLWQS